MRTRWMFVGSLLTLAAIVALAALGGIVLAQQDVDEGTPEPPAAEEVAPPEFDEDHHGFGRMGRWGHFEGHFGPKWSHFGDGGLGPLAHLAEVIGVSPEELYEALEAGQTLAEVAQANGMTREELVDALLAQADEMLEMADEMDLFDEEQRAFIDEWIADGVALVVDHPLPVGEEWEALHRNRHDMHDMMDLLDAEDFDLPERLADLLGLTLEELEGALLDGQTLEGVAEANGVEPQAVVNFLVDEAQAELDEAMAAGYLTEDQADLLRGWVEDGVARVMDNRFMFPNLFGMVGRMSDRMGAHMEAFGPRMGRFGAHLSEMDWDRWAEYDWQQFIGQDPLSVAAEAIGISRGELMEALMDGQTLEEVAEAHGVDPQAVLDAQTQSIEEMLDDLASEGLVPAEVPGFLREHLDEGMEMFMFGEHGMHGHGMGHWFNCCPCDDAEEGE